MRFSIFLSLFIALSLTSSCGKKKSHDEPPTGQRNDSLVLTHVQEQTTNACIEGSDTPPDFKDKITKFCQCVGSKIVAAMVKKCGGTDTTINSPCELTEEESSTAVSSCT